MITRETAAEIWECYREIESGEKLLADLAEAAKEQERDFERRQFEPKIADAFGRYQRLQIGIPSGESAHRLYGVPARLGVACITAHIAERRTALVIANEKARIELEIKPCTP